MRILLIGASVLALAGCGGSGVSPAAPIPVATGTPVSPTPAPSPTPTPTPTVYEGFAPIAAARASVGITLPLGKCVNMGNQLEAPKEGDLGPAIVDADFTTIRQAGFASVRIPVRFSGHADLNAPYRIDPVFMARVVHVVGAAGAAGLNVIIDMHGYDELMSNSAGQRARFVELWRQIGVAFASAPATVWFELINEPNNALDDAALATLLPMAVAAVRTTNPTRPVIVGGQNTSGINSLATLALPDDPYVVPTFHYYDPFTFTHQGATWFSPSPPVGRSFGSVADIAELNASLGKIRTYMQRTGRVPFVGEYGAIDEPNTVSADQRVLYYGMVSNALASAGIQSCAWAYRNTFKLRDGNGWLPGMLSAIGTTTTR